MRAVVITEPGGPEVLQWEQVPDPEPSPDEVLIDVAAAGVNRADLLQRQGFYPPPAGAPPYPGMEVSGRIESVGANVAGWQPGDEVCALMAGGGYAEKVTVPGGQVLPVPAGLNVVDAAALPEAMCTVYSNLVMVGGLRRGETLLVHGGASGIGTTAIQLGKALGARVLCTAGSAAKLERCRELGADVAISYRDQDFAEVVKDVTDGHGADVILDIMGASYLARNLATLAIEGRLVIIGRQGGSRAEIDLGVLQSKRASIYATTLRNQPVAEKSAIVAAVTERVWPLVSAGTVRPIIDETVPMAHAAQAHRILEAGGHTGKILLVR
ncbi:MAG TPA: NAD(P)H-quinone oxidoreductase [Streptosporangiaceae bacterium]